MQLSLRTNAQVNRSAEMSRAVTARPINWLRRSFSMIIPTFALGLMLSGCGTGTQNIVNPPKPPVTNGPVYPDSAVPGEYPSATDNLIYSNITNSSFYKLLPYSGLPRFYIGDPDAKWLGNMPGFEYVQGHIGASIVGDTLEVQNKSGGLYMRWGYTGLWEISLTEGWKGQIETGKDQLTGISIGTPVNSFISKFSDSVQVNSSNEFGGNSWQTAIRSREYPYINIHLRADSDLSGSIKRLSEDSYLRPTDNAIILNESNHCYMGFPNLLIDYRDCAWLKSMPGFSIYQKHNGGIGDTLEIINRDNGMFFMWIGNSLNMISMFDGWKGQIELDNKATGIKIGGSVNAFLSIYPHAVKRDNTFMGPGGCYWSAIIANPEMPAYPHSLIVDCDGAGIIKAVRLEEFDIPAPFDIPK